MVCSCEVVVFEALQAFLHGLHGIWYSLCCCHVGGSGEHGSPEDWSEGKVPRNTEVKVTSLTSIEIR